jgi:dephospho-CoA kinase
VPGELIVVTGPPGAGKSTVARVLTETFSPSALVTGDDFFGFVRAGWIEPWLPEAGRQNEVVLTAAAAAAGHLASGGYTVVYDGVVGPWFLPLFAAATGLAELGYVVLLPTEELCVTRVSTRSGHGFTDTDAAREMHRQFDRADVEARHVLRDPVASPAAVATAIRERLARGTLRHLTPAIRPSTPSDR